MTNTRSRTADGIRLVALALALAVGCHEAPTKTSNAASTVGAPDAGAPKRTLMVAAGLDLAPALKEMGALFEQKRGTHVELTFNSTNDNMRLISDKGAVDVFVCSVMTALDQILDRDLCLKETKTLFARTRIVMWSKDPKKLPKNISELKDPKYAKIAMSRDSIAYGHAARQALTKIGIWSTIEPRVIYANGHEDILKFQASEEIDVTFLPLSRTVQSPANFVEVDTELHDPIDQALAACKRPSKPENLEDARAFVELVSSPPGRAIMRKAGFLLPTERL